MKRTERTGFVVCVSLLVACHTWTPSEIPQPAQPLAGAPKQVRVVLTNGTAIVLIDPYMSADTLVGDVYNDRVDTPVRRGIPIAQIKALENPKVSSLRTAWLLLGLGAVLLLAAFYILVVDDPNY